MENRGYSQNGLSSVTTSDLFRKERVIKTCIYLLNVLGGVTFSGEDGVSLAESKKQLEQQPDQVLHLLHSLD